MSTNTREVDRGVGTRERGVVTREGGVSRVKGALPRERGVVKDEERVRERVEEVLRDAGRETSVEVYRGGVGLYNKGTVHETAFSWVMRVGSENGGLYGYEVDLSAGTCGCKAFQMRGYVCRHFVAAGMKWVEKDAGRG